MKRITLFIPLLLLLLSTSVFAQEGETYEIADSFRVTCLVGWGNRITSDSIKTLSPTQQLLIDIKTQPISEKTIDDKVTNLQKALSNDKQHVFKLEESYSGFIDNLDAKYLIYSSDFDMYPKQTYIFLCIVYSQKNVYAIIAAGDYTDLETDRKTIDEVIASIKILK